MLEQVSTSVSQGLVFFNCAGYLVSFWLRLRFISTAIESPALRQYAVRMSAQRAVVGQGAALPNEGISRRKRGCVMVVPVFIITQLK